MNDNDTAIACKEVIKHAENTACIYHSENGKDCFDVTLVLCSDGFSSLYHKKQNLGFLFSVHDFSRPWCIQCLNDDVAFLFLDKYRSGYTYGRLPANFAPYVFAFSFLLFPVSTMPFAVYYGAK